MSKILDKIKGFGHSLTSMFQENDQEEEVDYLNPNTEEAKKLAEAMKPAVDRINALESQREKEQKKREEWLKNLKEGDVIESEATYKAQEGQARQTTRLSGGSNKRTTANEPKVGETKTLEQSDGREGR